MKRTKKTPAQIDREIDELFASARPAHESARILDGAAAALDEDPQFEADYLKSQFVEDVLKQMEEQDLNKNTLAEKLGKSRQYVGRVLNETANFTIETMTEIAFALDMRLAIKFHRLDERVDVVPAVVQPGVFVHFQRLRVQHQRKMEGLRPSEFVPEKRSIAGPCEVYDARNPAA